MGATIQVPDPRSELPPLQGHLLLHTGARLSTAPEGSAAAFELNVSARGALFTILGEREGWLELESWHQAPEGEKLPSPASPPACIPLARGLEVVNLAFFVERKTIDEATVSVEDPLVRFGCPSETPDEKVAKVGTTEAELPPLQSGRPRIRLPAGRGTHLIEYELSAGTRLSWPDRTPAGTVLLAHRNSEPIRKGDEDERLGPSSLQVFHGEDLLSGERTKVQREQFREWADSQTEFMRQTQDEEAHRERMWELRQGTRSNFDT